MRQTWMGYFKTGAVRLLNVLKLCSGSMSHSNVWTLEAIAVPFEKVFSAISGININIPG